jgi:hypothetical protein
MSVGYDIEQKQQRKIVKLKRGSEDEIEHGRERLGETMTVPELQ